MSDDKDAAELEQRSEQLGADISDAKDLRDEARRDETIPGIPAPNSGLPPDPGGEARAQDDEAPWPDE